MPSIKSNFSINYEDCLKLQEKISKIGYESEQIINNYVHTDLAEQLISAITKKIPVSKKGKNHAKYNLWYSQTDFNLAVDISNNLKGKRGTSFYYLYYVVTGTGTSKEKGSNDFMSEGLESEYSKLVDGIIAQLDKYLEGGIL